MAPDCRGVTSTLVVILIESMNYIYLENVWFSYLIKAFRRSPKVFKKVLYWSLNYLFEIMRKVEIDNVEEMVEKTVTKDGKVGGLMKYTGKTVLIIVTKTQSK
jgi:hypothetical protein